MLVDVVPDKVVVVIELVAVTVVDVLLVDVPVEAVAAVELVVAVTSRSVADAEESPDPGSVDDVLAIIELADPESVGDVVVIKELTDPGSVVDVGVIKELTGSVFVAGARVDVMVATRVIDTFKVITLSVVDMPIDASSLSIIEILADILIPTTTTIFIELPH